MNQNGTVQPENEAPKVRRGYVRGMSSPPGSPSLLDIARLISYVRNGINYRVGVNFEIEADEELPTKIWIRVMFKIQGYGQHVSKQFDLLGNLTEANQAYAIEGFILEANAVIRAALEKAGEVFVDDDQQLTPYQEERK